MTQLPIKRGDLTKVFKCPNCGEFIPIVYQGLTFEKNGNTTIVKASAITIKHQCASSAPPAERREDGE